MVECLENILRKGFDLWEKNIYIAMPFIFNLIASLMLLIVFIGSLFIFLSIPITLDIQKIIDSVSILPDSMTYVHALIISLFFIVFMLLNLLINAFFSAGAIGMAKEAIESIESIDSSASHLDDVIKHGNKNFGNMIKYANKKVIDLFLANLIITAFILLILFIFVGIPLIVSIGLYYMSPDAAPLFNMFLSGVYDLGAMCVALLLITILILFTVTPYAIVISDVGALEGLKKGYGFFMDHKLAVLLFLIFIHYATEFTSYAVSFIASLTFSFGLLFVQIPPDIGSMLFTTNISTALTDLFMQLSIVFIAAIAMAVIISLTISTIIIQPLTTIWWSLLYMDRIKEK